MKMYATSWRNAIIKYQDTGKLGYNDIDLIINTLYSYQRQYNKLLNKTKGYRSATIGRGEKSKLRRPVRSA